MLGFHSISEFSISENPSGIEIFVGGLPLLSLTGLTPSVGRGIIVPQGNLVLVGHASSLSWSYPTSVGSLNIVGQTPTLETGIPVAQKSITLTGLTPTRLAFTYAIPQGSITLTGQAPTVGHAIPAGVGALTLLSYTPTLLSVFSVPSRNTALTGLQPTIEIGIPVGVGLITTDKYALEVEGTKYFRVGGQTWHGVPNQAYSFEIRAKFKALDLTGNIIHISSLDTGLGWCTPFLTLEASRITGRVYTSSGSMLAQYATAITTDVIYHIVTSWDLTNRLRLFVNGVLVASNPSATSYSASGLENRFFLGFDPAGCAANQGGLDYTAYYFRAYDRALSETEVAERYIGLYNNETGLRGKWDLDDGSGNVAIDSSGSGNNGVLINEPRWVAGESNLSSTIDLGISVGSGTLVLTGQSVSLETVFSIPVGTLVITGQSPSLAWIYATTTGVLTLTGQTPSLADEIPVGVGSALITSQSTTLGFSILVDATSLSLASFAPTIDRGYIIPTYVFDFVKEDVSFGLSIGPGNPGVLTLTGYEATPGFGIFIEPDTATLTLTPTSNTLAFEYAVPAQTLTLTAQGTHINVGPLVDVPLGQTLEITTYTGIVARGIIPPAGSLTLTNPIVESGLAQAGSANTLTLGPAAPILLPISAAVRLTSGAGSPQERPIKNAYYASKILEDKPLAYWRLGESSGPVAVDSSGNGHDATYSGPVLFGQMGALISDPDTNTAVRGDDSITEASANAGTSGPNPNDVMTVEFWFKGTDHGSQFAACGPARGPSTEVGWHIDKRGIAPDGSIGVRVDTSAGNNQIRTIPAIEKVWDGEYHHLVLVLNNGIVKWYLDSKLVVDSTYLHGGGFGNPALSLRAWASGRHTTGTGESNQSFGDEVAIYDYELSANRVLVHYQAGTLEEYNGETKITTVEPRWRTNALLWSGDFANPLWGTGNPSNIKTPNSLDIAAPDGSFTACKYENFAGDAGNRSFGQSSAGTVPVVPGRKDAFSFWVWVPSSNSSSSSPASYMFAVGDIPSGERIFLNTLPRDQWIFVEFIHKWNSTATGNISPQFCGNFGGHVAGDVIYVWHPLLEIGVSSAGDYIETKESHVNIPDETTGYEIIDTSLALEFGYSVSEGTLTLSGYVPTRGKGIIVGEGQLSLLGSASSLKTDYAVPTGIIEFVGFESTEGEGQIIPTGSASFASYVPTLDVSIPVGSTSLGTFTGLAPARLRFTYLIGGESSLTLTGYEIPSHDTTIPIQGTASLQIVARDPRLRRIYIVEAETLLTFGSDEPTLALGIVVPEGSLSLQGSAETLEFGFGIGVGTLSLTTHSILADVESVPSGVLELTTYAPTLEQSIAVQNTQLSIISYDLTLAKEIPVAAGSLVLTGNNTLRIVNHIFEVDEASLELTVYDSIQDITIPLGSAGLEIVGYETDPDSGIPLGILVLETYSPVSHNSEFDIDLFTAQPRAVFVTGSAPSLLVTTLRVGFRTEKKVVRSFPERVLSAESEPQEPNTKREAPSVDKQVVRSFPERVINVEVPIEPTTKQEAPTRKKKVVSKDIFD